jgi:predicted ATPase
MAPTRFSVGPFARTGDFNLLSIRMKDFRSIEHADLWLNPLTLIVGGNSAGKSSLLGVIRLMMQAQQQGEKSNVIDLNGVEIELGRFTDLVRRSNGATVGSEISLGFTFQISRGKINPNIGRSFQSTRNVEKLTVDVDLVLGQSPNLGEGFAEVRGLGVQVRNDDGLIEKLILSVAGAEFQYSGNEFLEVPSEDLVFPSKGNVLRSAKLPGFEEDEVSLDYFPAFAVELDEDIEISSEDRKFSGSLETFRTRNTSGSQRKGSLDNVVGSKSIGGLPNELYVWKQPIDLLLSKLGEEAQSLTSARDDVNTTEIREAYERFIDELSQTGPRVLENTRRSFLFGLLSIYKGDRAVFLAYLEEHSSEIRQALNKFDDWTKPMVIPVPDSSAIDALRVMTRYFSHGISYLGPLRQGPKSLYTFGERGEADELGKDARYFAYYLSRYADTLVDSFKSEDIVNARRNLVSLSDALSDWAKQIGIAEKVIITDQAGTGRRVQVLLPGLDIPIEWDKVGVGVSQVLPVLLKVLVSSPHSLILLEQPELHLHPDAQAELAEFLLAAAVRNRKILVETHSDVFITRLRRKIVEGLAEGDSTTKEAVGFIFAVRDKETGVTEMQNVETTQSGNFVQWPKDFADQVAKEAELLVRAQIKLAQSKADQ